MNFRRLLLRRFRSPTGSRSKKRKPAPSRKRPRRKLPVPSRALSPRAQRRPEDVAFLTTDFVRPGDRLKGSMEGFLLDQRSEHTRRAYGKDLKRFVKFLLARIHERGSEPLERGVIIAYKESLLGEGLQPTTVDRHLATLKALFGWLASDGLLDKSPAENVRFLNPKKLSTTVGFSDEEVRKILRVPDLHARTGAMHYAILMMLFYCGLRRSELCALRISNLSEERGQKVVKLMGKGGTERLLPLIPPVWNALKYYMRITGRSFYRPGEGDPYLFAPIRNNRTGVTGKPLDPSMIYYIVVRYARMAGIQNRVSPHSCRATAISNARDHDVADRAIQEFAGWSSPQMITRYDKRRTAIEDSAAKAIAYGSEKESRVPEYPIFAEMPADA